MAIDTLLLCFIEEKKKTDEAVDAGRKARPPRRQQAAPDANDFSDPAPPSQVIHVGPESLVSFMKKNEPEAEEGAKEGAKEGAGGAKAATKAAVPGSPPAVKSPALRSGNVSGKLAPLDAPPTPTPAPAPAPAPEP